MSYFGARLALFLACWGVVWLIGAKGVLGVLLALIISGLLSYIVLDKLRNSFALAVRNGFGGLRRRFAAGKAAEDTTADKTPE